MRKRFKTNRLCSSDNYSLSRKLHREFLKDEHNNNAVVIEQIVTKHCIKKAYVKCFGELVPITLDEARNIETIATVIWL